MKQLAVIKYYTHILLSRSYFIGICYRSNKLINIKSLHLRLIISEFNLIKCKKPLNHCIHLVCLVHNNITVKFHALRIICYAFLKSLRAMILRNLEVPSLTLHFLLNVTCLLLTTLEQRKLPIIIFLICLILLMKGFLEERVLLYLLTLRCPILRQGTHREFSQDL